MTRQSQSWMTTDGGGCSVQNVDPNCGSIICIPRGVLATSTKESAENAIRK